MGCDVYANGDEIACKAGSGKVIASFPDVCLTPPPPPAGPIPVPYPDTSFSKDMQKGSKTVMIEGQEVMLKDQSFYKTSPLGDEAATNGQGAGVVTHVITGKTYFVAWSMDVKFEDQNVDRHTDMTTSNHACPPANASVPNLNAAKPSPSKKVCKEVNEKYPVKSHKEQQKALKGKKPAKQSHHVIQNSHFVESGRGETLKDVCPGYEEDDAPCIPLLDGSNPRTEHGRVSKMQKADAKGYRAREKNPTYSEARDDAKEQLKAKPKPGLTDKEAECILTKVDEYFKKVCGGKKDPEMRKPGSRGKFKPKIKMRGGAR